MDKTLARLIGKKWKSYKITNIRYKSVDSTDIKCDHLDKADTFLKRHKLSILTQKKHLILIALCLTKKSNL